MKDQYTMFSPVTSKDSPNAISSPVSVSGPVPSVKSDGLTQDPSGPSPVRARPSARPERKKPAHLAVEQTLCRMLDELASSYAAYAETNGLPMPATYSRNSGVLSGTSALNEPWVNRLRLQTDVLGSPLYVLQWKYWDMPIGPAIPALRARARQTLDKDCTLPSGAAVSGFPTPQVSDSLGGGSETEAQHRKNGTKRPSGASVGAKLRNEVLMAGWPTASSRDCLSSPGMKLEGVNPDGSHRDRTDQLPRKAQLAGWPAPTVGNAHGSQAAKGANAQGRRPDGSKATVALPPVAQLAGWPALKSEDGDKGTRTQAGAEAVRKSWGNELTVTAYSIDQNQPARLTTSGALLTGSGAGMESGGQLNPEHSLWLMGIPREWLCSMLRGMQSIKNKRRRSSVPSCTINPADKILEGMKK